MGYRQEAEIQDAVLCRGRYEKSKVDPAGAEFDLVADVTYSAREDSAQSGKVALERGGIMLDAPTRFVETDLCPGDPVFMLGTATEQEQGEGEDRVVIRSSVRCPLLISEGDASAQGVAHVRPNFECIGRGRQLKLKKTLHTCCKRARENATQSILTDVLTPARDGVAGRYCRQGPFEVVARRLAK